MESDYPRPHCLAEAALEQQLTEDESRETLDDPREDGPTQEELMASLGRYLTKARETLPVARKKFLQGLPSCGLFAVVRRTPYLGAMPSEDLANTWVAEFYIVDGLSPGTVWGHLWMSVHPPELVNNVVGFPDSEVVDWLIVNPDGSIEGNWWRQWAQDRRDGKVP
ncbi:MAG: hypothetical protein HY049_03185 [Acidobacteria bacterium]|nr:hypothetical protein [Acidobacteriota bacterium]